MATKLHYSSWIKKCFHQIFWPKYFHFFLNHQRIWRIYKSGFFRYTFFTVVYCRNSISEHFRENWFNPFNWAQSFWFELTLRHQEIAFKSNHFTSHKAYRTKSIANTLWILEKVLGICKNGTKILLNSSSCHWNFPTSFRKWPRVD